MCMIIHWFALFLDFWIISSWVKFWLVFRCQTSLWFICCSFRMFSNEDVTIGAWMLAMNVNHEHNHALCEPDCTPSSIAVWDIPTCSGLYFLGPFLHGKIIVNWHNDILFFFILHNRSFYDEFFFAILVLTF